MKRMRWWLALVLVASLLFGTAATAFADNDDRDHKKDRGRGRGNGRVVFTDRFSDWQNGFWGNEALARMIAKGIIQGNPDLTVAPNRLVSRLEAAVMLVRMLGLKPVDIPMGEFKLNGPGGQVKIENKRGEFELKFKGRGFESEIEFEDDELIPLWGRGYVLTALQHGFLIFDGAKLNPMAPLNRIEAAIMLVKAAGLEEEARNRAGADLNFTDENAIPSRLRGYIAIAVERGYVTGYPDNTFKPFKPVSRAEWAALIDRLDRQVSTDARQIKGTVTAVTLSSGGSVPTISMTTPVYPNGVTYPVDDTAVFYVNRREATIADIHAGDQVLVQLNEARRILMVTVVTPAAQQGTTGTVAAFTAPAGGANGSITIQPSSGSATSYAVSPSATVLLGSASGSFGDVRTGDRVTLAQTGGLVSQIQVHLDVVNVSGSVNSVGLVNGLQTVGITTGSGQSVSYPVADWAVITNEAGASLTIASVQVGNTVDLRVERGRIARLTIRSTNAAYTDTGVLQARNLLDGVPSSVSILRNGQLASYNVASNVTVTHQGSTIAFSSLVSGDNVTLSLNTSSVVQSILVNSRATESRGGTIGNLDLNANAFTLTSGSTSVAVNYSAATEIRLAGSNVNQPESVLQNGQQATVTGAFSGGIFVASRIEVTTQASAVSGTVQSTLFSGSTPASITIVNNGLSYNYSVASGVTVTHQGNSFAFGNLLFGDTVTLTLVNNVVQSLVLNSRATDQRGGTISNLDLNNNTFTVTSGSSSVTVYYNASTQVRIPGSGADQPETVLQNGQQATVTGGLSGGSFYANRIDVTATTSVTGAVQSFSFSGSTPAGITVVVNGLPATYSVAGNVAVTYQGNAFAFGNLMPGDSVTLTLSNNIVQTIVLNSRATDQRSGAIGNLDLNNNTFTLTSGSTNLTVTYNAGTQIRIPGNSADQAESALQNGQQATVTGALSSGTFYVHRIDVTAQPSTTVSGAVQSIQLNGSTPASITIVAGSLPATYPVASNVTVAFSGTALQFGDLRPTDTVTLTLTNGTVTAIAATARATQTLTGVVSALNTTAQTFTLTVTTSGGQAAYAVHYTNSTVTEGFAGGALADGQTVRVEGTFVQGRLEAAKIVKQ